MHRHRRELRILSEINLTNLVDTSFVLLLGFMLMAPAIKHGIEVQLPEVTKAAVMPAESKSVTIQIHKKGPGDTDEPIYILDDRDEKHVTLDEIQPIITEKRNLNPKLDVIIEGDREATLNTFAKVLSILKNMGIDNVGMPLETTPDVPTKTR
jgi:biopolymer transport protein TolR